MTIKEAENFYKQDKKEYNLTSNTIMKKWLRDIIERERIRLKEVKYAENYSYVLKNTIKGIYTLINDIKKLQELINYLTIWYEIKYPDKEMDLSNGVIYKDFQNIKPLSKEMDINQLIFRLDDKHDDIISCYYRARSWSSVPVIINNKIVNDSSISITLKVKNEINHLKNDYFISLNIDYKTGLLAINSWMKMYLGDFIDKKHFDKGYIHIEDLVNELEKKSVKFIDYNELIETILDRDLRLSIRKEILELAALKMLYSENTIPEYGYERAKRFINEMNKKLNANLTTKKIDEIMNKNYKEEKKLIKKKSF